MNSCLHFVDSIVDGDEKADSLCLALRPHFMC